MDRRRDEPEQLINKKITNMANTIFCAMCAFTVLLSACLPLLRAWEHDKK